MYRGDFGRAGGARQGKEPLMERDANYGLIGGLTLALLAAAFGFILWLGQSQFARNFDEYRIIFDGPVRGLSEGGEVQFNVLPVDRKSGAAGERDSVRVDFGGGRTLQ